MARIEDNEERRYGGGGEPVREEPPDRPGRARGPGLLFIVLLGLLVLAVPVAWGVGYLVVLTPMLGTGGVVVLWLVWAIVAALFVWTVWSMWRHAA